MAGLRVGVLVNPIAGVGGPAALKGSDGQWQKALARGVEPLAQERGARFVAAVPPEAGVSWLTVPGSMGVPGLPAIDAPARPLGETSAEDTRALARALAEAPVDLLCFVGGDGTAADVAAALGDRIPCLGVPAGVKITSAVFAFDLEEAAWIVEHLMPGFDTIARDVTDLDEEAYRAGRMDVTLRGALRVPVSPRVQGGKVATTQETPLDGLVDMALRDWDPGALHLVGAGSVCGALKDRFWGEATLLGVDAIRGDRIRHTDLDARTLTRLVGAHDGPVHLWLSPIGGQGMLLGRGTQVLSPATLRRIGWERIHVLAPQEKLLGLAGLHVDSGDPAFDHGAPPYLRVTTGWNETRMVRILHARQAPVDA